MCCVSRSRMKKNSCKKSDDKTAVRSQLMSHVSVPTYQYVVLQVSDPKSSEFTVIGEMTRSWFKLTLHEVNLALTLPSGQCFRWKKRSKLSPAGNDVWMGVIGTRVLQLEQDVEDGRLFHEQLNRDVEDGRLFHEQLNQNVSKSNVKKMKIDIEEILRDYFQLGTSLESLYKSWSENDELFKSVSPSFPGVRVLRQDPTECLFSFICSSCNNIKRITRMIDNLCLKYGQLLHHDDEFGPIHSFPTVETLSLPGVEEELRDLGFGYRGKFIQSTAKQIVDQKIDLLTFRSLAHNECHSALLQFTGIGSKVADCIALFSMDKVDTIPVDTHVYSIATRDYKVRSESKSVTKKTYKLIGDFFRSKFPSHAGWAHSVLFAADLNMFKDIKSQVSTPGVGEKSQVSTPGVGKKSQVSTPGVDKKSQVSTPGVGKRKL